MCEKSATSGGISCVEVDVDVGLSFSVVLDGSVDGEEEPTSLASVSTEEGAVVAFGAFKEEETVSVSSTRGGIELLDV